jgi:CDGSH-type Zn-finger protein/uncharacterized Fe-S cluster protein YjdI
MSKLKSYQGKEVSITFELQRCIHSEECGRRLTAVFDAQRRPWVEPDAAPAEKIAQVVSNCPSGALHAYWADGEATESLDGPAEINVRTDGPLQLRGNIEILATDGTLIGRETRVALCRCGRSENKPFCDNSHIGQFDAPEQLGASKTHADKPVGQNHLSISPIKNGPYILKGSFVISTPSEDQPIDGNKGALCRCGHSNNKPFCDGSHRTLGFEAD